MKDLQDVLQSYASFHKHRINRLAHVIGIPIITLSTIALFSWLHLAIGSLGLPCSWLLVCISLAYYMRLDKQIGLFLAAIMLPCTAIIVYIVGPTPTWGSAAWCLSLFAAGWALQLIGHLFEGRRPAFVNNLGQLFIAPLYLFCKFLIYCGVRTDLKKKLAYYL